MSYYLSRIVYFKYQDINPIELATSAAEPGSLVLLTDDELGEVHKEHRVS